MPSIKVPVQQLEAEIDLGQGGGDSQERRKTVTWYTGATVRRGSFEPYRLTLSMNPGHVRMQRLQSGKAPVLDSHSDYKLRDVIGVVESAAIREGRGYAALRFSDRPEVDPIWNDIRNGIIRNASVGAAIHQLKDITAENDKTKSYLAVDWEPLEISIVPIGADMEAGFRASHKERLTEAEIVSAEGNNRADEARTKETAMPEEQIHDAGSETRDEQQQTAATPTMAELAEAERERIRDLGVTKENARVTSIIDPPADQSPRDAASPQHPEGQDPRRGRRIRALHALDVGRGQAGRRRHRRAEGIGEFYPRGAISTWQ